MVSEVIRTSQRFTSAGGSLIRRLEIHRRTSSKLITPPEASQHVGRGATSPLITSRPMPCDGGGGGNRTRTSRATCFARALGRQGSQRWSLVTVGSLALVLHLSRWFRAATQSHRLSSTRRAPEYDSDARIATPCSAFSSVAIRKPSSCGPPKAG